MRKMKFRANVCNDCGDSEYEAVLIRYPFIYSHENIECEMKHSSNKELFMCLHCIQQEARSYELGKSQ